MKHACMLCYISTIGMPAQHSCMHVSQYQTSGRGRISSHHPRMHACAFMGMQPSTGTCMTPLRTPSTDGRWAWARHTFLNMRVGLKTWIHSCPICDIDSESYLSDRPLPSPCTWAPLRLRDHSSADLSLDAPALRLRPPARRAALAAAAAGAITGMIDVPVDRGSRTRVAKLERASDEAQD